MIEKILKINFLSMDNVNIYSLTYFIGKNINNF